MYKLCMTERSAARQRELETGLLSLMGVRRYDEITVSNLCEYLKVPRKSFYRYFSGKEGALQALLDHTLMEFEFFHGSHPHSESRSLEDDLEGFFLFWLRQRPLMDVLERNGLSSALIQRCVSYAVTGPSVPKRFLEQESEEEQKMVILFAVCGLMTLVLDWHHSGYSHSPAYMGKMAVRALSQPLFPNISDIL